MQRFQSSNSFVKDCSQKLYLDYITNSIQNWQITIYIMTLYSCDYKINEYTEDIKEGFVTNI